jgi:Zn-dependent peptidase ImmA (M78 family)
LIDLRDVIIYLDQAVSPQKQAFLKLHEVGHKVLPWQRATYLFLDDQKTLSPDVKTLFERQANCFAAEVLF